MQTSQASSAERLAAARAALRRAEQRTGLADQISAKDRKSVV